jgi:hypothetical protein
LIDIPGKLKVLRYRYEELNPFRREARDAKEWGVDLFGQYIAEEYPEWYEMARVYDEPSDYIYVILTEGPVPVLSTVKYDDDGKPYIEEQVVGVV